MGAVRRDVELGVERTVEIDVAFGFRQLIDIAEKALSPAVNDPTTGVQAIHRVADLVNRLAVRPFPEGVVADGAGTPRVFYTPITWPGLVHLAFDELRDYGAESRQVARRLRAALEDLLAVAPPERRAPVEEQLALLDRAVERAFPDDAQRRSALVADHLGLGGEI
jgi:uncharacterized membrane protein